jgi:hypothetical protein
MINHQTRGAANLKKLEKIKAASLFFMADFGEPPASLSHF